MILEKTYGCIWKWWLIRDDWILAVSFLYQNSSRTLQDLKRRRLDLRKEGNALIDFFCEDKDSFKLDECFRIFQDFCLKFKKAVKVQNALLCELSKYVAF